MRHIKTTVLTHRKRIKIDQIHIKSAKYELRLLKQAEKRGLLPSHREVSQRITGAAIREAFAPEGNQ